MNKKYNFIVLKNIVTLEYINSLYKKINLYKTNDYLIIFKIYKNKLEDDVKKIKLPKVKNIDDIFNLDDPNKVLIKQLIKDMLEEAIENIIVPCLNIDFLSSNINIDGYGTFVYDKKLFIICKELSYSLYSNKSGNSYLLLDLLSKFLL